MASGIYDSSMCQLSPVIVTFCQLPIFDLGCGRNNQTQSSSICPLLSFCFLLLYDNFNAISKIKCIFYDSFQECAPLGANLKDESRPDSQPGSLYDWLFHLSCLLWLCSLLSSVWFYIVYLLFPLVCVCVCVKVYIFICFDSKADVFMTRLDSK